MSAIRSQLARFLSRKAEARLELARAKLARGDFDAAEASAHEAADLLGPGEHLPQRADLALVRGEIALARPDDRALDAAWQALRDGLQRAEQLRNPWLLWRMLYAVGRHAGRTGRKDACRTYHRDAAKVLAELFAKTPDHRRGSFYALPERAAFQRDWQMVRQEGIVEA